MTGRERVADPFFGGSLYIHFQIHKRILQLHIYFHCREHTSGFWGLGITISISAGAGRRSKAIKGIDGGKSIRGRLGPCVSMLGSFSH